MPDPTRRHSQPGTASTDSATNCCPDAVAEGDERPMGGIRKSGARFASLAFREWVPA